MTYIQSKLFELQDKKYRDFNKSLIPGKSPYIMIGVRTPELRRLAKELSASAGLDDFLDALPHEYYEENQMHAFILADMKDYERCIRETERFLPYVDNWATCDSIRPKIFGKHKKELLEHVRIWLSSAHTYTLRFAVDMLMTYYLGEDFREEYAESVIELTSGEYYVNMMRAWYFATAFAKNYEDILPCFERHRLDVWTHNKAIQKALESFRVSDEHKEYLRTLKIKG